MKHVLLLLVLAAAAIHTSAQTTITIMEDVIFHDGYAALVTSPPPPANVLMHRNDLAARKLTTAELESIGTSLQMNVTLGALCDNYDRIGNVNMALVPKGQTTYHPDSVQRIELGRFITPFFNKNIQPDTIPYTFNIDNVALLLKEESITSAYDIWIELSVFGVPYAANTQVAGCAGRNDVFKGKLEFVTEGDTSPETTNLLIPIFINQSLNNYQANATDNLGQTVKTILFSVPEKLNDASFFLITSNHGANSGGEEYNRRKHNIYLDNNLILSYTPGRTTCEPFRVYNTQANGIYGQTPKTPEQWQAFSNWCPGDVIDIRKINVGKVQAGTHSFQISVPSAQFVGQQGNIPVSLYLHGKTSGWLATGISEVKEESIIVYPNPSKSSFTVELENTNASITISDIHGRTLIYQDKVQFINHFDLDKNGVYFIHVKTNNSTITKKLIVNK
jgi:hypothetical protein